MTDGYLPEIPGLYKNFSYGCNIEETIDLPPLLTSISWGTDLVNSLLEVSPGTDTLISDILELRGLISTTMFRNYLYEWTESHNVDLIPTLDGIALKGVQLKKMNITDSYLDISNWEEFDYVLTTLVNTKEEADKLSALLSLFHFHRTIGGPVQLTSNKFIVGIEKNGPETIEALSKTLNYLRSKI